MNQESNKGNAGCGIAVIVVIVLVILAALLGSCDDSSSKSSSRSSGSSGRYSSSTTMGAAEYIRQNDPDLYNEIQNRYDSAVKAGW